MLDRQLAAIWNIDLGIENNGVAEVSWKVVAFGRA